MRMKLPSGRTIKLRRGPNARVNAAAIEALRQMGLPSGATLACETYLTYADPETGQFWPKRRTLRFGTRSARTGGLCGERSHARWIKLFIAHGLVLPRVDGDRLYAGQKAPNGRIIERGGTCVLTINFKALGVEPLSARTLRPPAVKRDRHARESLKDSAPKPIPSTIAVATVTLAKMAQTCSSCGQPIRQDVDALRWTGIQGLTPVHKDCPDPVTRRGLLVAPLPEFQGYFDRGNAHYARVAALKAAPAQPAAAVPATPAQAAAVSARPSRGRGPPS